MASLDRTAVSHRICETQAEVGGGRPRGGSGGILEKAWLPSLSGQLPCSGINSETWPGCKENKTVCD